MLFRVLIFIILLPFTVFSQNIEQELLSKLQSADNLKKIEIYNQLCWKLRSNNISKAIEYGDKAIDLITKINEPKLLSKSFNFLGVAYRNSGNYSKALFFYTKALNNALQYSDSIQIAYSHNNIGGIYRLQGNNSVALEHMLIALKYFEETNNQSGIGFCTINIGIVYQNEGNYKKSLKYLNYSLDVRRRLDYKQGIALTLYQIAMVYRRMKKYSVSLRYYKELLSLFTKIKDTRGIAACREGFSTINYEQGHYQSALKNILLSKNILEKINDKVGIIRNYGKMALIYARLKKFSLGKKLLDSALTGVKKLNIEVAYLDMVKTQAEFYGIEKDYKKAFSFQKKYAALSHSIYSKESTRRLVSLQSNFDLQQKEKENLILKREAQLRLNQRNDLFIIIILVLILILVIFMRSRNQKRLSKDLKIANETKDKFFNIIAHDLRNPFNTSMAFIEMLINDFNNLSDKEKIEILNETKISFGKNVLLLENLLEWSLLQREKISYSPKLTNLTNLIDETVAAQRETAKMKNIDLQLDLETVETNCDKNMMRAAIRNLISNAIKFTDQKGKITIKLSKTKDNIIIKIIDSGVGIDKENIPNLFKIEKKLTTRGTNNEPGSGLGLILCKDFVELNNGTLTVESEINVGSIFTISFPS